MRKALNENPVVQVAVIGVLIVIVGFVFMMNMSGGGGGGGDESAADSSSAPVAQPASAPSSVTTDVPATGGGAVVPVAAEQPLGPEPPAEVREAFDRGDTIVLFVYRPGGIEDARVRRSVESLRGTPGVSVFIVPASDIGLYSHLTRSLQVSRVPALIVVSPKRLSGERPVAQVHYGYLGPESVRQAVIDAEYEGPPASYGPR